MLTAEPAVLAFMKRIRNVVAPMVSTPQQTGKFVLGLPLIGITIDGVKPKPCVTVNIPLASVVPEKLMMTALAPSHSRYHVMAVVATVSEDLNVVTHRRPPLAVPRWTRTIPPAISAAVSASVARDHAPAATTQMPF